MKYLKTYQIFESGNTSFDWLRKQSNERYIDLMYILQSDVFDDFNIVSKSNETFEMGTGEEGYPEHKFWVFRFKGSDNTDADSSEPSSIGSKEIDSIIVFNIQREETGNFWELLLELKDKVKDLIGRELIISEEIIGTPEYPDCYDYIIKLGDKPKVLNESKHIDVKSDIEDILLELEDYGIEYSTTDVKYYKDGINPHTCIRVAIKDGKDRLFRLDDIMDVLLRLKDYLKGTKYSIDIGIPNSDDYHTMDKFMEEFRGEELYHIYLFIWSSFNLTW